MNRNSLSPRSPRKSPRQSPRSSPRLTDSIRNSPISPKKKDNNSSTFISLTGQNLHSLSPQARSKSVVALNLEYNQLTTHSLTDLPNNLTSLNLRHNPLNSCRVPNLLHLRSLILDGCGIKSFEGLPSLPNLRLLSIANNSIENFKDLPILTHLESINISNNAFDFDVVTTIAAIGSISLNKFNGEEITTANINDAFTLSSLVGYSLRKGRTPERFESPEQELEETQKFLSAPLIEYLADTEISAEDAKLRIETSEEGEGSLILPLVADNIKWYRDVLNTEKGSYWEPLNTFVDKESANILKLANVMKMHIIKCEFTINKQKFTLYTDQPIGRELDDLCLPFPIDPVLSGVPIEGSLVSLIPLPIPVRVAWVSGSRVVLQDSPSIILSNEEIGKSMTCLMAPYCPNYSSITFAVLNTETEVVGPLLPTVSGVQFPENLIQGDDIKFERAMTPDREGKSEIRVERAYSQTSVWESVAELDPADLHYTPTIDDVDYFLRIVYTPLTVENVKGETVYFYSKSKVVPAIPRFDNPTICGIARAGSPVVAFGEYIGGKRGNCQYIWYMEDEPIQCKPNVLKKLEPVCTDILFDIPEDAAGKYLAVEFIPIREDEVIGDSSFATTSEPIIAQSDEKKKERIVYEEDVVAGKKITLEQNVYFFATKVGTEDGFEAVTHGNSWTPKSSNVGQIIKVESPSFEGILGEVLPAPSYIREISLSYDSVTVDQPLNIVIKTHNLKATDLEVIWIRVKGDLERAAAFNTNQYIISGKDVGFQIKARVTQFDNNGNRLPYVETELTPVVKESAIAPVIYGAFVEGGELGIDCEIDVTEVKWQHNVKGNWEDIGSGENYLLKKSDIGRNIRAICNINGRSITTTSHYAIDSALPTATVDLPEDPPQQGVMYTPTISYNGGVEGSTLSLWERDDDEGNWIEVAKNVKEYKPVKDDVGHLLRLTYTPQRKDRVTGEDVIVTTEPVYPSNPKATKVKLIQNNDGFIEVQYKYSGGEEGDTVIEWYAILPDGANSLLAKVTDKIISPHPDLFGMQVYAIFSPTRIDGEVGDEVRTNTLTIEARPIVTEAEIIGKGGNIAPENLLRVKYSVNKPGSKMSFQWYKINDDEQIPIEGATDVEYTPKDEDSSYFMGCSLVATARNGWVSDPFMAVSSVPVSAPKTRIKLLDENGEELPGTIPLGTGIYPKVIVANVETDDYSITWQCNTKKDKKKWIDISEEKIFYPSANEVGLKVRAIVDDEKSATKEIVLPEVMVSCMKSIIRFNSLKIKCSARAGLATWNIAAKSDGIVMKSKSGVEKKAKWSTVKVEAVPDTRDEMKLLLEPSSCFIFTPTLEDARIESNIGKENVRDFVVVILRNYTQQ